MIKDNEKVRDSKEAQPIKDLNENVIGEESTQGKKRKSSRDNKDRTVLSDINNDTKRK